jgi:hypothetical protein
MRDIERYGRLSSSTVKNRFGSIRSANEHAGLEASYVQSLGATRNCSSRSTISGSGPSPIQDAVPSRRT